MSPIPRRSLLKAAAVAGAAAQFSWALGARDAEAAPAAAADGADPVTLDWLEDGGLGAAPGTTVGVPWPMGAHQADQSFAATDADGRHVPVQTWPLAYWPDGSLKWTAHAVGTGTGKLTLTTGTPAEPARKVTVDSGGGTIDVSTGVITAKIGKNGTTLIKSVTRGSTEIARNGRLVLLRQPEIEDEDQGTVRTERFDGAVSAVTVEQDGPVRAVVRVDGRHRKGDREWLPFSLRLYFYAGSDSFRMVHTITYDGKQEPGKASGDFIRGLGVRFTVPMRDPAYDRHIRIGGEGTGLLREAVQGVTGLRRDPGTAVQAAQYEGKRLPDPATWDQRVTTRLRYIPHWGDYTLAQLSADGFTVRKRTKKGHGWITAGGGRRASGFGYVGGASGGLSFGLRDFWEKFPAQLDIRDAHTDRATVTLWLWSPEAQPMDLRFYHDGMGQDSYAEQLEGLNITYEDYEPGFGTPYGIARTSELLFWANDSTPTADTLARQARAVRVLPQLAAPPAQLVKAKVFGPGLYSEPDRSTPAKARIEDHLDFLFTYYKDQVEMRRWYGFWDYGDIMHTYDSARHVWRYDIGGYAWDNSELSPDLWLWYAYLRSGRCDIFRFAEAMTRHTGEVDVYHLGTWAGLGTRHGVQHFADSAKQQRIANTTYRRFYYFLTADERVGDLMHANVDSDETFLVLDPQRKVRTDPYTPDRHALSIGFGTDWSGLVSAWLTEWERKGPKWEKARARVLSTMAGIAAQPNGFVQGSGLYDLDTGEFAVADKPAVSVSHLSAVFGLNELCAELIHLVDMPKFKEAYLDYCRYFNATKAEQTARYGTHFGSLLLFQGHSRLDAYAAVQTGDAALAERAWAKFFHSDGYTESSPWKTERLTGPATLVEGAEAAWVSTNDTALYGLAAIENLALLGDRMPA
ncbi:Tat pathway signal sequence domain protein [Streptomyces eurythermus]|uniref:exo-rhamnogalacturonan lyase family protein n=1 Tax=Streptomyces eurythermus TaxID=42237 RepID=UPI0036D375B4